MVAVDVHKNVGFDFLSERWRSEGIKLKINNLDWLFEWEVLKTVTTTVEIIKQKQELISHCLGQGALLKP